MISRYACALNGRDVRDLDPALCLLDVEESAPPLRTAAYARACGGQTLSALTRDSLSVRLTLEIHEPEPLRRAAVVQRLRFWATEGYLTLGHRPNQRLYVVCDAFPALSALRWTQSLTLTLTAYGLPFWQAAQPVTVACSGTEIHAQLLPPGDLPCRLEAEITALAPVRTLTLAARGTVTLATELAAGQTLTLSYEPPAFGQCLRIDGAARFLPRSDASSDEVLLLPRAVNAVTLSADGAVRARLFARGVWR